MEWIEQKETRYPSTWIYKNGAIEFARVFYRPYSVELNKYVPGTYKLYSYEIFLPGIPGKVGGVDMAEKGMAIVESKINQWFSSLNLSFIDK